MTDSEESQIEGAVVENDLYDEDQLERTEADSGFKYEQAQRELVTQTVDFNIKHLADMLVEGQIDTNPKYQRRARWDSQRQSKLIESFLMNVPMPPIFLSEEEYGFYAVIDGQQRLRALKAFFSDELVLSNLEVFSDLNGHTRSTIPAQLRRILDVRPTLRCIIIQKQSHPGIKYEVFGRLNTGGVKLNSQEIRNSAFRGRLNDLILDLAESYDFRKSLNIKKPDESMVVQQMRDCELVLRFFTLKESWKEYDGSLQYALNDYMAENKDLPATQIKGLRREFDRTLAFATSVFGDQTFQRFDVGTGAWRKQVVVAMYDAEMLASYEHLKQGGGKVSTEALNDLKAVFVNDKDFERAVLVSTNTPSRLRYRVNEVRKVLERCAL